MPCRDVIPQGLGINDEEDRAYWLKYPPMLPQRDILEDAPIAKGVLEIERRLHNAMGLLDEIIATLLLDGNAHLFSELPPSWHYAVENWHKRYDGIKEP